MRISFFMIILVFTLEQGFASGSKANKKHEKLKRSYEEIAKASGGVMYDVDKSEKGVTELMINMSKNRNEQRIFYVENEQNPTFNFITNSQTGLTHVVVNSRSNMKKVIITSPSGSTDEYDLRIDQPSIFAGSMEKPAPGLWRVEVQLKDQSKSYKANVVSSTNLYVFPSIYDNRFMEYENKMTIGQEYIIKAGFIPDIYGATINVTCLSERRVSLCGTIQLDKNYMGKFTCPNTNFFINFDGILEDGTRFQKWVSEMKQAINETLFETFDYPDAETVSPGQKDSDVIITVKSIRFTESTKSGINSSKDRSRKTSNSSSGQLGQIYLSLVSMILFTIIY